MLDVTENVKAILTAVRDINKSRACNLTILYLTDIYKGANLAKIRDAGLTSNPIYGRGKSWNKVDIERLLHKLVIDDYLKEDLYIKNEIACAYLKIGTKADEFMRSKNAKVRYCRQSKKIKQTNNDLHDRMIFRFFSQCDHQTPPAQLQRSRQPRSR